MALLGVLTYTQLGQTLTVTGVTVRITHGIGTTPDFVILTPSGTTATGGATVVAKTAQYVDIAAYGVASGLVDVCAVVFHSIQR